MPSIILTMEQTRRYRMKQTVSISGNLSYLHGYLVEVGRVGTTSWTVFATYVGEVFPIAGCAGVEIEEEAVGVDFGGGVPGGLIVVC